MLFHQVNSSHARLSLRSVCCFVLAGVLLTGSGLQAAGEPRQMVFSCWIPAKYPAFTVLDNLYRESFAALGYTFTMVEQPALRSLTTANKGITDGECIRVATYLEAAPSSSLERVNTLIAKSNLGAWSHDSSIKLSGASSLLGSGYSIAYIKGMTMMDTFVKRFPLLDFQEVNSVELGVKMLMRKRFDILIAPEPVFEQEMADQSLGVELYWLGTLMVMDGYAYMHNRHHDLIPSFAAELEKRLPAGGLNLPQ
ncbi:MAG TPA: hypothetical protein VIC08_13405 [Cellvibrionaceae bacterium]